jgi:hypothetical protein
VRPPNKIVKHSEDPAAILSPLDRDMVRVTPLASAALLSLAAVEVVIAKFQQHLRDPSSFQDTCDQIATSISNASFVYYSRESLSPHIARV